MNFRLSLFAAVLLIGGGWAQGQTMMEDIAKVQPPNLVPSTNTPAAAVKPAPPVASTPPATNAAPAFRSDLDVDRYGKILGPGNEPAYPLKLVMPFPGIGELKIPSSKEVEMRQKIELLAGMSDADIRAQLAQWPAFTKMSLTDEGAMLTRIQQFRERRTKLAAEKAHSLGLLTLNAPQMARFEKEYWDRQLKMDQQFAKQFEPAYRDAQTKMQQDLFREFSSLPASPAPKPAPPKPAVASNTATATSPAH